MDSLRLPSHGYPEKATNQAERSYPIDREEASDLARRSAEGTFVNLRKCPKKERMSECKTLS